MLRAVVLMGAVCLPACSLAPTERWAIAAELEQLDQLVDSLEQRIGPTVRQGEREPLDPFPPSRLVGLPARIQAADLPELRYAADEPALVAPEAGLPNSLDRGVVCDPAPTGALGVPAPLPAPAPRSEPSRGLPEPGGPLPVGRYQIAGVGEGAWRTVLDTRTGVVYNYRSVDGSPGWWPITTPLVE